LAAWLAFRQRVLDSIASDLLVKADTLVGIDPMTVVLSASYWIGAVKITQDADGGQSLGDNFPGGHSQAQSRVIVGKSSFPLFLVDATAAMADAPSPVATTHRPDVTSSNH
jgi:hypothetical protein